MRKLRIKKDFVVKWAVYSNVNGERTPYLIDDAELILVTPFGKEVVEGYKFNENVVEWTFRGKDQKYLGVYNLELVKNNGQNGMVTVDTCKAFMLVAHSCDETPDVGGDILIETLALESDIVLAPSGVGSYDDTALWKELENKVDKVEGFGLSEENYTAEEKEKLAGLQNYDDTAVREELKKKLSVDVVIAPTNDAQVLMSAFKTYDLANKLNVPMQCLIKKERSDEDYMLATLIVEDYRSVNAGYRLTFTMYGNKTNAMSGGKIDEQSVYSPDAQSVDNILSYLYNEQYGYVIPLGTGNTVFPNLENKVKEMLKGKVDAEEGKGLSTNDFTDADKEKLEGLQNYDDTSVREELARLEKDKADKTAIPTKVSELENDADYVTEQTAMRDYQPKGDYVTPESFKTINGESIVGKGNIAIEGGGSYDDSELRAEIAKRNVAAVEADGSVDEPFNPITALYKKGVVTQDLTREGSSSVGYKNVVSNPQYGVIPQQFIDQVWDQYAVAFNETTGYFEYADITNLAYDEVMRSVSLSNGYLIGTDAYNLATPIVFRINAISSSNYSYDKKFRVILIPRNYVKGEWASTNSLPSRWMLMLNDRALHLEIVNYSNLFPQAQTNFKFYMCQALRKAGNYHLSGIQSDEDKFVYCFSLEEVFLKALSFNINIGWSPLLKNECILFMIQNEAATKAITITLHPTAHARAMADESIVTALEAHPNITLASA